MNFKIDRFADIRFEGYQGRIEPFSMAHLEHGIAFFGSSNHAIRFFQIDGDRLLDQNVNPGLEQAAGDFGMRFTRHRETGRVDLSDQTAPIRSRLGMPFVGNGAGSFIIEVTDRGKTAQSFACQRRV
jgi:hypothetical protein